MSIKEMQEKIKPFYLLTLFVVIASIFFALGRISALEDRHSPIKIQYSSASQAAAVVKTTETGATDIETGSGEVIGSKSGKKYYYPWCGTVARIKPENQVHFASIEEAKKAGFTLGGNCKGLK